MAGGPLAMNEINVIAPYKYLDIWVFDDEKKGLVQEAFVGGADSIIDLLTNHIPDAENGFVMLFSGSEFPGSQHHVEWRREQGNGNVYYSPELQLEGWLCPALLRYFEHPPPKLFIQVKPRAVEKRPALEAIQNG
jgi:hypothetical protein